MLGNLIGHRDRDTHTFLLVVLLVTHKPLPRLNGRMNTTLYGGSTRRANTGLCRRTVTSAWVRCIAMGDGTSRPGEDSPSLSPYTAPWQWVWLWYTALPVHMPNQIGYRRALWKRIGASMWPWEGPRRSCTGRPYEIRLQHAAGSIGGRCGLL